MLKYLVVFISVIFFTQKTLAFQSKNNEGMEFNVSGYGEGQVGIGTTNAVKGNVFVDFNLSQKIDDKSLVKADLNLGFGSATYESRGSSASINDAFITFQENKIGKIELGITHPVTEKFRKDASTFACGTGGINGDYFRYVKYNLDSTNMILSPQMPTAGGFATSNYIGVQNNLGTLQNYFNGARGAKISAISNQYKGFTFGASFTPRLYDKYTALGSPQNEISNLQDVNNNFDTQNSISLSANYDKNIAKDFNISISALYENGKAKKLSTNYNWRERQDLNSWSLGFNTNYKQWFFGGSYVDYGNSLFYKADRTSNTMKVNNNGTLTNFDNSYLCNIGVGYITEKWGLSSSYLVSNYMGNKSQIVNLSLDRNIKVGKLLLKQYVETAYTQVIYPNYYDSNSVLQINNKTNAFVVFTGLRLVM
jgi:hypothetical protein